MTTRKRPSRGSRKGRSEETEADFLSRYDVTVFDRFSVSVDVVLLSVIDGELFTVLIRRKEHPHKGQWSLPGGFLRKDESLPDAAARVLEQKVGLGGVFLEQLFTFGAPNRDPRTRVITVAYFALVDASRFPSSEHNKGHFEIALLGVPWEGETGGPVDAIGPNGEARPLAFDHADILGMSVKRIRGKLDYTPIGFQLLPPLFTLRDLQVVHETVLGRPLNKDSFRRRMLASGLLEATGERRQDAAHRPAELYRFSRRSAV